MVLYGKAYLQIVLSALEYRESCSVEVVTASLDFDGRVALANLSFPALALRNPTRATDIRDVTKTDRYE